MAIGRVGVRPYSGGTSTTTTTTAVSIDTDAQAFITATAITDTTQKNAINDLVLDLKAAGVWTKMKALYPMVGGTATTHKFNLKDPRDLDAAFRLTFYGGVTHNSSGIKGNGVDGWVDTYLNMSTNYSSAYDVHFSTNIYSDFVNTSYVQSHIGASATSPVNPYVMSCVSQGVENTYMGGNSIISKSVTVTTHKGFYCAVVSSSTNRTTLFPDNTFGSNNNLVTATLPNVSIGLLARRYTTPSTSQYSNFGYSFFTIGTALTNLEQSILSQITEKFQYALGRNVNANRTFYFNRNYSNETNAFIFNGAISDATQQSAINTLVNDLKAAGIWTKMKALYPMVGGTALAHKFNLVNPIDSTSAYALTFNGGWTHTTNGATPNGTTGYANTNLIPNTADLGFNFNMNISFYSRTNRPSLVGPISDMGCLDVQGSYKSALIQFMNTYDLQTDGTNFILSTDTNTLGMIMASRTANNSLKAYRNGGLVGSNTATISNSLPGINYYLGAFLYRNASGGFANYYGTKECAFASIGNGLTDAEATTFYNAVQAFQTTLGRQV